MTSLVQSSSAPSTPESLVHSLRGKPGLILLRSNCFDLPQARYSIIACDPFLTLRLQGSRCELQRRDQPVEVHFGNPWRLLDALLARYELLEEIDLPFPLGGAFGYFGYDLRRFLEPGRQSHAPPRLPVPDGWIAFHDSLVAFDHRTGEVWVIATGLRPDGSRDAQWARRSVNTWLARLEASAPMSEHTGEERRTASSRTFVTSNFRRETFCAAVESAQRYIRAGDIYQVNLSQCLGADGISDPWAHWLRLTEVSPAPFAAFMDGGDFQLASISPELFLRLSGRHIVTRPIKGTRPRSADPTEDAQFTYDLQTSAKEVAELVMITDLLRNDLGRVCEYGSVHVPDLLRLEKYSHVQHLVSTVEGTLRPDVTHLAALEACFPGGSITGAPKIRAMEIIDELEPVARGPYTGCAGYLGFNRESQLNILIRTSVIASGRAWYHAGAGIVADSDPLSEYEETLTKAQGFMAAVGAGPHPIPQVRLLDSLD